jgi:hypothetical protein
LTATWRYKLINTRTLIVGLTIAACSQALAQTDARQTDARPAASTATGSSALAGAQSDSAVATGSIAPVPYAVLASALSSEEVGRLRQALRAAKSGDTTQATALQGGLSNPIARKLVTWAMIDSAGSELDFATLAAAGPSDV